MKGCSTEEEVLAWTLEIGGIMLTAKTSPGVQPPLAASL
jgi:hypothetical protein